MTRASTHTVGETEGPQGLSPRERDDDYRAIIHQHENWRVIVCKDSIQWIIQRAKKVGTERRWHGVSYVTTKQSLIALWSAKARTSAPALTNLPPSIRGDQ